MLPVVGWTFPRYLFSYCQISGPVILGLTWCVSWRAWRRTSRLYWPATSRYGVMTIVLSHTTRFFSYLLPLVYLMSGSRYEDISYEAQIVACRYGLMMIWWRFILYLYMHFEPCIWKRSDPWCRFLLDHASVWSAWILRTRDNIVRYTTGQVQDRYNFL